MDVHGEVVTQRDEYNEIPFFNEYYEDDHPVLVILKSEKIHELTLNSVALCSSIQMTRSI